MSTNAPDQPSKLSQLAASIPFGRCLLFLLLFVPFFPFVWPPDIDLDPSWRMMLAYLAKQGIQYGTEFVFTYGPLGFLTTQTFSGHFFWLTMAWGILVAAGSSIMIIRLLKHYSLTHQIFVCVFMAVILPGNLDQLYIAILIISAATLLQSDAPTTRRLFLTAGLLALFSLIKFTFALVALVIVATAVIYFWCSQQRRQAKIFAAAYAGVGLLLWILCRQSPLNLPAYFINSLDISLGYGKAMSLPSGALALRLGLIEIAGLLIYALAAFLGSADRKRTAAHVVIFLAVTFLVWKHGFVRADGHMMHFFVFGLMVSVLYPVVLGATPRLKFVQGAALVVAAIAGFFGIHLHFPDSTGRALHTFNNDYQLKTSLLLDLPGYEATLQKQWDDAAKRYRLERVRKEVKHDTVDVLSHYQGVALLNDLNYLPRPVPQSYSAYTPRLNQLDAAHYESARAPKWVLQRTQTIDGRLSSMDDAPLQIALLRNYTYAFQEGPYLIWKRNRIEDRYTAFAPEPGTAQKARIGDTIPLGELEEKNIWAKISVKPTLLGRLRSFFYQPAQVLIEISDTTGRTQAFRLLPEVAAEGFLLNPLMRDQFDWLRFISRLPNARVRSIRIAVAAENRRFFQPQFTYEFDRLPLPPYRRDRSDEDLLAQTGGFRNLPVSISADSKLGPIASGGEQAVLIHAPSEMVFNVGPGATRFKARYGIADSAYVGDAKIAGAGVLVEWKTKAGTKTLFERWLDPLNQVGDRGLHALDLDLSSLGAGTLIVRNTIRDSNSWAWTVWRDLEILPMAVADQTGRSMLTGSNHVVTRYGNFAEPPISINTGASVIAVKVDGVSMIQAHAPSELALQIPPGAKRAVGRFAMQVGTYTNEAHTDGAEFSVAWKSGDDERILFRRYLDPVHSLDDRGVQKFEVDLQKLPSSGTLLLRTDPGPARNSTWDWTCWSDVEVGDPQPLPDIAPDPTSGGQGKALVVPTHLPVALFKAAGFKTIPSQVQSLVPPGAAGIGEYQALQVHPPSTMVVKLGANPSHVNARYGLQFAAVKETDGVDYSVEWHGPNGERRLLFQRSLKPLLDPKDGNVQTLDLPLSGISGGELHFRIECGAANNAAYDWACWQGLDVLGAIEQTEPVAFKLTASPVPRAARKSLLTELEREKLGFSDSPVAWSAYTPPALTKIDAFDVLQVHAPGSMTIPLKIGAHEVTGSFGFPQPAYSSATPTDGATFIIEWQGLDGTRRELFRQELHPYENINDSGLKPFKVSLVDLPEGDLHFRTEPGPQGNLVADWTCWQGITLK